MQTANRPVLISDTPTPSNHETNARRSKPFKPGEQILYRGRAVQVETVSEINCRTWDNGMDYLRRDARGQYYYCREVSSDDLSRIEINLVHRLSLTAAILWKLAIAGRGNRLRADAVQRLDQPTIRLGHHAKRTLATFCRRHRVEPGHFLRAIVEQFLADALADHTLAPCVADEARIIARTGNAPANVWRDIVESEVAA